MVHDVGWTMMDIGKRIERAIWLTALVRATLTKVRSHGAEQTITESTLVACESSVIYRRRTLGKVSVAAVADLVLFDEENPRSLAYQFERLRVNLKALPSSSGSTRPERLIEEIAARLRRLDPADLEDVSDGTRPELDGLLTSIHSDLRDLSRLITTTHLALPGGMQPLWGPDARRALPCSGNNPGSGTGPAGKNLRGDASDDVPLLRRRDQFLRSRLPHPEGLRTAGCLSHQLVIEPEAADSSTSRDGYGNTSSYFHVTERHRALTITSHSVVEVDPPPVELYSSGSALAPWRSRDRWAQTVRWPSSSPWICSSPRSPTPCGITPRRAFYRVDHSSTCFAT